MIRWHCKHALEVFVCVISVTGVLTTTAQAQYGGGGTSGAGPASMTVFNRNYHVGFDQPEAWGLKYFASASMLSGLTPPDSSEGHKVGSISIGLETDWLPNLDAGQERIGFHGTKPEDLDQAPVFVRPVVRVGLPWKLTAIVAGPPPFEVFGLTP